CTKGPLPSAIRYPVWYFDVW
nr:immunoglobulin heavy chain junction region [Macaca mulatta]MOY22007.1 immunoglobulin heavy chain junction region [Macaca mulatta]MOY22601.1 immunoglobulin heavy chain junction region [Macaca mulatta]MOY22644.1 immunoglobulin heavy chain junction region [Macaca mulatta]MOY22647.1 immunoglobulin heavy chain junction region [Macaca mulatta]